MSDCAAQTFAELRDHLLVHSIKTGDFTLKSGRKSSWFIDSKQTVCRPEAMLLVADAVLSVLPPEATAIGGLTMGADPVATAIMHAAASRGTPVNAFVVRKKEKDHGTQRRIEGPDVAGRRVLAVEDTSTTGTSPLTAVDALREAGAEVVGVAVLVNRGAREKIADRGLAFRAAYELSDLGVG